MTSGNAGGSWATQANWSGGTLPTTTGDTADFSALSVTANSTLTLDGNQSINSMIFGNQAASPAVNWTMSVGTPTTSTLTLGGTTPTITVNNLGSGKYAVINPVITGTSGLTIAGTSMLELFGANTTAAAPWSVPAARWGLAVSSVYTSPNVVERMHRQRQCDASEWSSVKNLSASFSWYVPQLTIQGTVNLTGGSRLSCSFGTIDLNGGTGTINVNSKSLMITNRAAPAP